MCKSLFPEAAHQTPGATPHVSTHVHDKIFGRLCQFGSSSHSLALQHFDLALWASWWNGRHFAWCTSFYLGRHACLLDWSPRFGRADETVAITEAWRCTVSRPSLTRHYRVTPLMEQKVTRATHAGSRAKGPLLRAEGRGLQEPLEYIGDEAASCSTYPTFTSKICGNSGRGQVYAHGGSVAFVRYSSFAAK